MPPVTGSSDVLRILLVEDNLDDAALVERQLRRLATPYEVKRVETAPELKAALVAFRPHVVLSDFSMPAFSGQKALELLRSLSPSVPFIFVSGTIGEQAAKH